MDIVEYAEKILGSRLNESQKFLLRNVLSSRRGKTIITVPKENGSYGNRCRVMTVDETAKED